MLLVLAGGSLHAAGSAPDKQEQWIALVAPAFREAVLPLAEHRKQQGFRTVLLDTIEATGSASITQDSALSLQTKVRELVTAWPGRSYVLLVGAATAQDLPEPARQMVPSGRGVYGRMKGEPTDNDYGLPDASLMPKVAVGRMPARTVEEARAMVAKTIQGEQSSPGEWRHRLTFLAGSPSYYAALDKTIESLAMSTLEGLSPGWSLRAVYYNANSSYTLPDDRIGDRTREYLSAGQAVVVYEGHSGPDGFWRGARKHRLFSREDWGDVDISPSPCLFCTFACNGAQLCGRNGEGYGIHAIRNPKGPVAVVGAHCEDDAAMSMLISNGLIKVLPVDHTPVRVGDLWLGMLKNVSSGSINAILHRMLDEVDGDPTMPHDIQRKMHLEMFVLLGDPAFQLAAIRHRLELSIDGVISPGSEISVKATIPDALAGASGRIAIERAPTDPPAALKPVPAERAAGRDEILTHNHDASNAMELASQRVKTESSAFEAKIQVPLTCTWSRLVVRVYLQKGSADAMGAKMIRVKQPASKPAVN